MNAYIKSNSTFHTILQFPTLDYNLCLDSMPGDYSSVTIAGDDLHGDIQGQWLILNSKPYRIAQVTPDNGKTRMTVAPVDSIFDRDFLYDGSVSATVGAWIAKNISDNWINQPDGVYATPYISVLNLDNTPFQAPKTDENGVFNLLEYMREMRRSNNIVIHANVDKNRLVLTVTKDPVKIHQLVLNDGHTRLASSSFSAENVAKITVIQPIDTGNEDSEGNPVHSMTQTDWYLSADGVASTSVPAHRASGGWTTIFISPADDQREKVEELFSENVSSHKVELFSDTPMYVGDRIRVNIYGVVFDGVISARYLRSGDSRILYKSGELATTLQEQVRSLRRAK